MQQSSENGEVLVASMDIRVGDTVSSRNAAQNRRPANGVCAIAGEDIRRGEQILIVQPFAWSASS